jgi:hypothetical protein
MPHYNVSLTITVEAEDARAARQAGIDAVIWEYVHSARVSRVSDAVVEVPEGQQELIA